MIETIGWLGGICLALCGLPQAWKSFKEGHSEGISWGFLSLWLAGEVLCLVYILYYLKWPLVFNYTANIMILLVILRYKVQPVIKTAKLDKESNRYIKARAGKLKGFGRLED